MSGTPPARPSPPPDLTIDRCVCRRQLFAELFALAREGGWNLERLSDETGAGIQCGLCLPYLRRMLRTGETRFHQILTGEDG